MLVTQTVKSQPCTILYNLIAARFNKKKIIFGVSSPLIAFGDVTMLNRFFT